MGCADFQLLVCSSRRSSESGACESDFLCPTTCPESENGRGGGGVTLHAHMSFLCIQLVVSDQIKTHFHLFHASDDPFD